MRVLYISKYAVNSNHELPTRQFFYCKYLAKIPGNKVMLISSRSTMVRSFRAFRGRVLREKFGDLENVVLNGPQIDLGFNLRRVLSWIWFEVQVLRSFPLFRRWKPDVVMVSSLSIVTFLTGVLIKKLFRIPFIVEVRDIYPLTLNEIGGYSRWHPAVLVLGWIEKLGYRQASAIVSSLPNLGPHIEERLGYPRPVTWLPMGFDPEYYQVGAPSEQALESLRQLNQDDRTFSVGYCGQIGTANALYEPLQAFYNLSKQLPGVHFWIVGDGPLRERYEQEFGDAPNIHFLGKHVKKDVYHLTKEFDLVINPWLDRSIYRFGISPNKWIDYMFCAKPILTSYQGFPTHMDKGQFGWVVAPENESEFREAIVRLSNEAPEELRRRGEKGKEYLEGHLNYEVLARRLHEVIATVLNQDLNSKGPESRRGVDQKHSVCSSGNST